MPDIQTLTVEEISMTLAKISRHRDLKILLQSYYRETAEQIAARL